jgi:hypothetical protein
VTYALIEQIENNPGHECQTHLKQVVTQLNLPQPDQALAHGVTIMQGLVDRGVLEIA